MVVKAKFDSNITRKEYIKNKLKKLNLSETQIDDIFTRRSLDSIEGSLKIINGVEEYRKKYKIEDEFFPIDKDDEEFEPIPNDLGWLYSDYSKVNKDIERYFVYDSPREKQLEIISEIHEAIQEGYKYILLEAGTGTGKSAIAATLAMMYGKKDSEFNNSNVNGAYISTVTKQLQDQYMHDFEKLGFKLLKGKSNFICKAFAIDGIEETCNYGKCVLNNRFVCPFDIRLPEDCDLNEYLDNLDEKNCCSYYYQKIIGEAADVAVANYDYLYHNNPRERKIAIYDEAHNLENKVMSFISKDFEKEKLKKDIHIKIDKEVFLKLKENGYPSWIKFINLIRFRYQELVRRYSTELNIDKTIKDKRRILQLKKMLKRFEQEYKDLDIFLKYLAKDHENWVVVFDERKEIISFKAICAHNYAEGALFGFGDICLFMSATALSYKSFAKWLGINENELKAIRMKHPFDYSNNPIKIYDNLDMKLKKLPDSAPKTIPIINNILNKHKNQKGIIHTVSYDCRNYIMNYIDNNRLITHDNDNRAEILKEFEESEDPLVIVSPSMGEGVNLPGDKCRFQIIYKVPYPSMTDEQVSMRQEFDRTWYNYQAYVNFIQTYGRGMRNEDDWCRTYVLDSRLQRVLIYDERKDKMIPDYIRMAVEADFDEIPNEVKEDEPELKDNQCPNCGAELVDKKGAFCSKCGYKL